VLGFIWFLFLKSPDIQIKEISNRLFGTGSPAEQTIIAPEIQSEVIISPTQQEKDEIQQTKLKQMREKEELAAERARLEEIKAEIEQEKVRASEAQQAINSIQNQNNKTADSTEDSAEQAVETEQTQVEDLIIKPSQELATPAATASSSPTKQPAIVQNATTQADTNSTSSQVDLILKALKKQQAKSTDSN